MSDTGASDSSLDRSVMSDVLAGRETPDTSVTQLQAALLVDASGRTLFATEAPASGALQAHQFVGRDWREMFSGFEQVEIDSQSTPNTFFFLSAGEDRSAYRVRKWGAAALPGTVSGHFILVEAIGHPAATDELIYQEKMAALGQIAAGVAHEVNNPLTTVSGWLQIMLSEADDSDKRRAPLELMREELARIANIVHHLLSFGRRTAPEEGPVRVNSLLSDVVELVQYQIRNDNIQVVTDFCPDLPLVTGDQGQLRQVFLNIVVNARQAMPDGGVLTIRSRLAGDGAVTLEFGDTGCGMTTEVAQKIFEAFYTTKDEEGGSGIGLFLCRNIVKEHGGTLTVSSRPGEGSRFTIKLPAAQTWDAWPVQPAADPPEVDRGDDTREDADESGAGPPLGPPRNG